MLCKILCLPELCHGNEEVSVRVDGACMHVYGCGVWDAGRTCWQAEFLHLECHLEITCVLQVPNFSPAIKNDRQTGQSAVKN